MQTRYVGAIEFYFEGCWLGRLHNLRKGCSQRHLITEIHVASFQELLHLGACRTDAGQDGEYRFLALLNLLMQHIIDLKDLHQSWRTKDYHDGINIIHPLTVVDGNA